MYENEGYIAISAFLEALTFLLFVCGLAFGPIFFAWLFAFGFLLCSWLLGECIFVYRKDRKCS